MKVVNVETHPWSNYLKQSGMTPKSLLDRVVDNYDTFAKMGIGSEICSKFCSSNGFESVVFMMEYLPIPATTKLIAENAENIQTLINRMHSLGIYHGICMVGILHSQKKWSRGLLTLTLYFTQMN